MFETVEFESQGAQLRGRLYRPVARESVPVVVMAHGFSATITMTANRYADVFCEAGLGVLLYDHRNFGASGGEPRHQINPWLQGRGYRDAITYAASVPGVDGDRIALWGDSLSAAVALVVAGVDSRVAAVVAQVPATGRETAPADPEGGLYNTLRHTLLRGDISGGPQETIGPLPVVSADQINSPSLLQPIQSYRWFMEYGVRSGSGWENNATLVTPRTAVPFHAGIVASHIRCPILVHFSPVDEMAGANPTVARAVYDASRGPKEFLEVGGGHFGLLYYPSRWFDDASAAHRDFFLSVLT
jgi:uncharacterized protein